MVSLGTGTCPFHGQQEIVAMGAERVTLACGAVGSDSAFTHRRNA